MYEDFRQASRRLDRPTSELIREAMELYRSERLRPAGDLRDFRPRSVGRVLKTLARDEDALDLCRQWWNSAECRQVAPGAETGNLFLSWLSMHRLERKRLLDTLLAATWYSAGIARVATTNWRDFAIFEVFEVVRLD